MIFHNRLIVSYPLSLLSPLVFELMGQRARQGFLKNSTMETNDFKCISKFAGFGKGTCKNQCIKCKAIEIIKKEK